MELLFQNGKKTWPLVKLGDVCEVTAGNSAPQEKELFENGTHCFIRTSDVGEIHFGELNHCRDKLNDTGIRKLRLFKKGCILFPKSGASTFLNHRVLLGIDAYVASHLAVILPQEAKLDVKYLLHFLATIDAKTLMQDCEYPALRLPEIEGIIIPLPPLPIQRAIVARLEKELSETDRLLANFKRIAEGAEDEFKAELEETFSTLMNLTKPLGDACAIKTGKKDVNQGNPDGAYPFFTCARIPTRADTYSFDCSALLIAGNGDVGFTQKYEGKFEVYQRTYVLYDFKGFLRDYIYYVLQRGFREYAGLNKLGVAMPYIKMGTLTNFAIPYVPISEQTAIVAKLDAAKARCEKLKAAAEKGLQGAENLRAAILAEAFEG